MEKIIKETNGTVTTVHIYEFHWTDGLVNKNDKAVVERVAVIDKEKACYFVDELTKVAYTNKESVLCLRRNAFEAKKGIGLFNPIPNSPRTQAILQLKNNAWVLITYDNCLKNITVEEIKEGIVSLHKEHFRWKYLAVDKQSEKRHRCANLFSITDHLLRR